MSDFKDDIEKYRKGELTSAEMHALEKRALSDPFLADALEGAESISSNDFSIDLSEIDHKLLAKGKKAAWFTPMRIAAGVILMIGSVVLLYTINQPEEQLALQKEAPSLSSADSISKNAKPELLSLNQPKDKGITEKEDDPKMETGPTLAKADGSGEAKPTAGISSSTQTAPIVADEPTKADQVASEELTEINLDEEKAEESEKIAAAPIQQGLRKEAVDKDMVSRAKAKKSAVVDDLQLQRIVTGQVTSSEDGFPVPGVNVTVKGTTNSAITDMQGNYSISVESENQQLAFSFIGLQSNEVSSEGKSTVNVKLKEDMTQLSEVVVTGQGFKTAMDEKESPVIKLAEPIGGRKAYDKYLESNLKYPSQALERQVKGRVTISFTVGADGTLSEFNTLKSLGFGCDEELIRLVKEGPKWFPSSEDSIPKESKVRVKMRFDPEKVKK